MTRRLICSLAILSLIAVPAFADNVIYSGADMWQTGQTYTNLRYDPLPADFFCPGSAPFDGQINLQGVPLTTEPECILGGIDTIIHRLENAAFNDRGNTQTLIQFMALSLAGVEPFEVEGCGTYDVASHLDGEQPVTTMKITRTNKRGGTFISPLELNVKMVFTPRDGGEVLEVRRNIKLGPGTNSIWSEIDLPEDYIRVKFDTDGDKVADTMLPAPSNFAAGNHAPTYYLPAALSIKPICYPRNPPPKVCEDGSLAVTSCHCLPWSQGANPSTAQGFGCPTTQVGGIDVCHLHCTTNTCPEDWNDIEPIDEVEPFGP